MKKLRKDWLARVAEYSSYWSGSRYAFSLAIILLGVWVVAGHFFDYSDGWMMAISVGSAIVTFLMVFLIQNTLNRNIRILHIKIDELIRHTKGANNALMDLNDFTEEELEVIRNKYEAIAKESRQTIQTDSGIIEALFKAELGAEEDQQKPKKKKIAKKEA